jgi:hypothetical protein
VFLNQDYRSRAIGVAAAIGVLVTGVVVNRTVADTPRTKPRLELVDRPVQRDPKPEYYC